MNELPDSGSCPVCGFSEGSPTLSSYLPPRTLLADRYLVGKLLRYNGESADYVGYDTAFHTKIILKEYMPDALCTRQRDSTVIRINPDHLVQYKAYMQEFIELHRSLSKMRTLMHIHAPYEAFAANNTAYVVFDFMEGVTLRQYLLNSGDELTWEQGKKLFPPLFTTLSLVHNAGILHRGISPDTIFMTQKGELKLAGFGIAPIRTANSELTAELFAGFAAPEQYSPSSWHGTWTDVYGVAALLYRALTGETPPEAISRIGSDTLLEPTLINHDLPVNVSKALMAGLKLSTENRIQNITDFVTRLFEHPGLEEEDYDSSVADISSHAAPHRNLRKKSLLPSLAVFTAALVVIGLTCVAVLMALTRNDPDSSSTPGTGMSSLGSQELIVTTALPATALTAPPAAQKTYQMPDLRNANFDVINASNSYSFRLTPNWDYNEDYPYGAIYDQSILPKEQYTEGEEVTVRVSKGPTKVAIPAFQGLREEEYIALLTDKNIGIKYKVEYMESIEVDDGYVFDLSYAVGMLFDRTGEDTLTIYVAKNPETEFLP